MSGESTDRGTPPGRAATEAQPAGEPERWVDDHADAMFRFAILRLGDPERAEEAVQEAFLAAFQKAGDFEGRSQVRTWLIGIVRNKVVDQIRREARDRRAIERAVEAGAGAFESGGSWTERQQEWDWPAPGTPERQELRRLLEESVGELPATMREAFCLRVLDGVDAKHVCEILGITATNLWTLVHRAKLRLRERLTERWFAPREGKRG